MIDPISAHIVLSAALAITLGVLVRVLCVRRVPTIRSVIQAEKQHIVRIFNQAVHESQVLIPDVLERIATAGARDETGGLGRTGQSQLRAAARDCLRAQLIRVLFAPSGLSSDVGARLLADMLDQLQPNSVTPHDLDRQSTEREASRRLLEGAINRHISTSNATRTLAAVLGVVRTYALDYPQLIDTEDEAELTLESEWT